MKKLTLTFMVTLLIVALVSGCGSNDAQKAEVNVDEKAPEEVHETESAYDDGIYYAQTEDFDEHGWKALVTIIVEDGKISNVFYDEINEEEELKTFDPDYAANMEEKSGAYPLKAFADLEKSLIDEQNAENIDTVSGATHSSDTFKELTTKALNGSPVDTSDENVYVDGLYKINEDEFDDHGWKSFAAVLIKDGKIDSAFFEQINEENTYKTTDEEYAKSMEEESGTTPAKAHKALIKNLLEKQDSDIDTVTGATGTSATFKELVSEALSYAKNN